MPVLRRGIGMLLLQMLQLLLSFGRKRPQTREDSSAPSIRCLGVLGSTTARSNANGFATVKSTVSIACRPYFQSGTGAYLQSGASTYF